MKYRWDARHGVGLNDQFCPYCYSTKSNISDFEHHYFHLREPGVQILANKLGFPPERVVFCTLHAKMRVMEHLIWNLIKESITRSSLSALESAIKNYFAWPSFKFYFDEQGHVSDFTGVDGQRCSRILSNHANIAEVINAVATENPERILALWISFSSLMMALEKKEPVFLDILILSKDFGSKYTAIYPTSCTPYVHILVCHSAAVASHCQSLMLFSQQSFEGHIKYQKNVYYRATSRDGHITKNKIWYSALKQTLQKIYRIKLMELKRLQIELEDSTLNEL
jgi:hypothetical protein